MDKTKKKLMLIFGASSILLPVLFLLILVIPVLIVPDYIGTDGGSNGSGSNQLVYGSECGFTISSTILSKNEFKTKLVEYANNSNSSNLSYFAKNADTIYDVSEAYGINPELVVVRAILEGFSPGGGTNNYWGLGCTNTGGASACHHYGSFNEGIVALAKFVGKYSTLQDLMGVYAYIGDYWYNPGRSSIGGCYYAKYIYSDSNMPAHVKKACSDSAPYCGIGGGSGCTKTTTEDQHAYATYQVNEMKKKRDKIFGKIDESYCTFDSSSAISAEVAEVISWNDKKAWYQLTGLDTNNDSPEVSQSQMDKRMVTITVPVRVWNGGGKNPRVDTRKDSLNITVNVALANLWKAFFTDVYNDAIDFVFDKSEFGGCYVYKRTGGTLSAHAYGAACDINYKTLGNGYGERSYTKEKWEKLPETREKYQMIYQGSKIMEIAHKYTLMNGSDWNNPNDAMHFSFIRDKTRTFAKACQGKLYCS